MCPGQEGELMEKAKTILKFWPLHLIVLAITLIFEYINTITIPTPLGNILFLPMLFAMVAGLIIYLIKPIKWVKDEASNVSDTFVVVGISVFLAKVSITSGIELPKIFAAGPALILQEFDASNTGLIMRHVSRLSIVTEAPLRWSLDGEQSSAVSQVEIENLHQQLLVQV